MTTRGPLQSDYNYDHDKNQHQLIQDEYANSNHKSKREHTRRNNTSHTQANTLMKTEPTQHQQRNYDPTHNTTPRRNGQLAKPIGRHTRFSKRGGPKTRWKHKQQETRRREMADMVSETIAKMDALRQMFLDQANRQDRRADQMQHRYHSMKPE